MICVHHLVFMPTWAIFDLLINYEFVYATSDNLRGPEIVNAVQTQSDKLTMYMTV